MSTHVLRARLALRPLPVLAGLALSVLLLVAIARMTGRSVEVFDAPVLFSQALQFEDRANGSVGIIDPASGQEVARLEGEQGFARGVLRALVRERKRRGLGHEPPFLLQSHKDGSLTLRDPATGQTIHLDSFGPAQRAVFARIQPTVAQTSRGTTQ